MLNLNQTEDMSFVWDHYQKTVESGYENSQNLDHHFSI